MARPWRVARSLLTLRDQIDRAYPNRSDKSDGFIGDEDHQTRDSDHNPWWVVGSYGVVTAGDFTHDPMHGFDAHDFAEHLRQTRDPRIKYVISNRRIFAGRGGPEPWTWRPYTKENPHTKHFHISVRAEAASDGVAPWKLPATSVAGRIPELDEDGQVITKGAQGHGVELLQKALLAWNSKALPNWGADGDYGDETAEWVAAYQRANQALKPTGNADGATLAFLMRYV